MKNTELRIGNYLQRVDGSIFSVKRLIKDDDDILVNETQGLFTLGYTALPIPLTEEILLKCGLLLYDELDCEYRINETRYSIHKVTNFDGFLFCDGNNVLSDIKYLHQLQNLFQSISGKEMIVNI